MRRFSAPLLVIFALAGGGLSCQSKPDTDARGSASLKKNDDPVSKVPLEVGPLVAEKNGIKLSKLDKSPKFYEARLFLQAPPFDVMAAPKQTFRFKVTDFELGLQTVKEPFLASAEQGQYIQVIVDNKSYWSGDETAFEVGLEQGSHVVLAFLARSYHESIKHDFALTRVYVDEKTESVDSIKLNGSAPHLFYNQPRGRFVGPSASKILLDFFLDGTQLNPKANKVELTINGEKFLLTEWIPYVIEGLPYGETKIGLRLINAEGELIPGPFNEVERMITLAAE